MKFRITTKDMIIFCIFCVFLLYFSAIGVLNVVTLLNDSEFYGLNPIEAFSGKYIFATIFVFVAVLVSIFFSVSSTIFEREKGLGFGLKFSEKDEKGYSRWCTEKEMKKAPKVVKCGVKDKTADAAGVVFINNGKEMWVDNSENHTLVIGVTGSGKTTAVVDPLIYSLCKHGESMVITDPKGEIYKNHSELLRGTGYEIVVLNFRNPSLGNAWNPMTLPYRLYKEGNMDKAIELIDDVSQNIAADPKAQDPFWGRSSADYFAGCALGLMEDAKEEEVNINSINFMTTVGEDKFGVGSTYIKEYFTLKGEDSTPYMFASNTINSPNETKGGILSTFRQKIRVFTTKKDLSEMLSYSDFDMREIGKKKTAVFMVIHDEKTTYHALATIFIKQCYETLISVAQENGGPLPVRTNFILDEFANMPALKDVTTMVTAARSRQIRFTFIIQNFAQLNEVYGKEDAETIRSNCGNLIYLLTTELAALEEISKLCGEVKSKKDDKTATQPLVSVSDLQKMKFNEVIILRNRSNPFRTQLKQGFNTDWGDSEYGKADFYEREPHELKLFDVKEFVTLRKKSKPGGNDKKPMPGSLSELASIGMSGMNPLGGLSGMNPLGGMGGMNPLGERQPGLQNNRPIPSFEEFLAERNKKQAQESRPNKMAPFDVDELVKRIDAKIAEIEAQEKAEEAKKKSESIDNSETIKPPIDNLNEVKPTSIIKEEKPVLNFFGNSEDKEFVEKKSTNENVTSILDTIKEANKEEDKNVSKIPPIINTPPQNFNELMNQNDIMIPQEKPSIMISNPIDINSTVPELPKEPIINKPIENVKSEIINSSIEKPIKVEPINNFNELINNNSNISTNNPSSKTEPSINVDTSAKVVNPVISDDAFYDDFFDS